MGNKQRKLSPTTPHEWHVAPQQNNAKSHLLTTLCTDVCVVVYSFLDAKDHAACRRVCKFFCAVFDHAFQRGYVACAIHCAYVDDVNTFYGDGDPLRVAPADQKNLFAPKELYKMERSKNDKNATLIVNVAKMLEKGETKLQDRFLWRAQFKAVHLIDTETLEEIDHYCLFNAQKLVCFTMSTPCPKLKRVGEYWLSWCSALTVVSFRGCTALETVGDEWLRECSSLQSIAFEGCSALERVGNYWLNQCTALQHPDFSSLVSLKSVGWYWLYNCSSLKIADFAGCAALESVEEGWMQYCPALEEVNLESCVSLTSVGSELFDGCPRMRRVVLPADTLLPADVVEKIRKYLK